MEPRKSLMFSFLVPFLTGIRVRKVDLFFANFKKLLKTRIFLANSKMLKTLWFRFCLWYDTKENCYGSAFASGKKRNQWKVIWFRFWFRFVKESWFRKLIKKWSWSRNGTWSTMLVDQQKWPNRWSTLVGCLQNVGNHVRSCS